MTANKALLIQLDNLQLEIQALQVENQELKALGELDNTLEANTLNKEIEELCQRLMEAEETNIGFEQEVR